jgi:hypothetical protein
MYEKDGVFYADEKHDPVKFPKVTGIKPLDNYKLWVRFSTGETKECDFAALLREPAFRPLQDKSVFNNVYIDYGAPVWNNGEIDIAPEWLYENGKAADIR